MKASDRVPFSFVQSTWNLLETSAATALSRAAEAGLGVVVKEALANGTLARGARIPSRVLAFAEHKGVGPDAICLAAALALDCRPVVLTGPSTIDQLRRNLQALTVDLSTEEVNELTEEPQDPVAYWTARSALPWT